MLRDHHHTRPMRAAIALAALCLGPASLLLAPALARADVITLKDGSRLEGKIVSEETKQIVVSIAFGTLTIPRDQIVSIVKAEAPETVFRRRLQDLAHDDVAGRISLAREALARFYLRDLAGELAVEAWHIQPDGASATALLAELDYHHEGTSWVPPERWYPAHDYVRRDKRWIWREEAAWRDALAGTQKAKAALALAQEAVKDAEQAIATAITRRGRAAADAREAEAQLASLGSAVGAAQTALDARTRDLEAADAEMRAASSAAARERAIAGGIAIETTTRLLEAETRQRTARRQRDEALDELQKRQRAQADAGVAIGRAKAAEERAIADEQLARQQLPLRREEAEGATKALALAQAAEYAAKVDLDARKAKESKS